MDADRFQPILDQLNARRARFLERWRVGPTQIERQATFVFVRLPIGCGACGAGRFTAFERRIRPERGSAWTEEMVLGVDLRCAHCDRAAPIFDWRSDGYDGETGELPVLRGPEALSPIPVRDGLPEHELDVGLTYNIDAAELAEIARPGQRACDYFDWFHLLVHGASPDTGTLFEWECG